MANEDIPLDVIVTNRLEDNRFRMEFVAANEGSTIFKVPENIREANTDLYEPHMVSIGPYFYNLREDRLRAMEDHKWRLLRSFLCRNKEHQVDAFLKAVRSIEKEARQSYSEYFALGEDDFIQMLLVDGCFILELFFKWLSEDADILSTSWGSTTIFRDLLLFENQIPFFVIERLHDIVNPEENDNKRGRFRSQLARFLMGEGRLPLTLPFTCPITWSNEVDHLLDLYHQFHTLSSTLLQKETNHDMLALPLWKHCQIHWITPRPDLQGVIRLPRHIPCTIDLHKVGVNFRKKQWCENFLDVTFHRGILEIPRLQIDSNKKALLKNLLVLEKQKTSSDKPVTSYVMLMDSLIDTAEDVAFLQHAGVIRNMLSTHQEAAIFFNQLGESMSFYLTNNHYRELFIQVQQYYDSKWNRRWARLMHDYFNSPWAVISVIAGVILLSLSALQTYYTVYPYYVEH